MALRVFHWSRGSLALVTCREPLRVSLTNHLWQLLLPQAAKDMSETAALDQVVHILSTENLELGCNLIEKAVVDKALKDIEESIAPALQARREQRARNPGVAYYDTSYIQPNAKWPQALPDMLRPKPGPLSAQQLKVYKDFNTMPMNAAKARLPAGLPPLNVAGVTTSADTQGSQAQPTETPTSQLASSPTGPAPAGRHFPRDEVPGSPVGGSPKATAAELAPATALEQPPAAAPPPAPMPEEAQNTLNAIVASMDQTVQALLANAPMLPPIDAANPQLYKQDEALDACTALGMLGLDHELVNLLRQVPHWISQCSHAETCALEMAQRIFKRLYEAPQAVPMVYPPDTISLLHLVLEVVGEDMVV